MVSVSQPERRLTLRPDDLKWTATDKGITVLDLRTARYLQLNRSGAVLWERLAGGSSEADLVQALCTRYGIDAERARPDVVSFLAVLRERGFLVEHADTGSGDG